MSPVEIISGMCRCRKILESFKVGRRVSLGNIRYARDQNPFHMQICSVLCNILVGPAKCGTTSFLINFAYLITLGRPEGPLGGDLSCCHVGL